MTGAEAMERVLRALRSRLREHWGQIARIEAQIGKSRGYLSRTLRGSWPLPLDVLLRTLDVLGVVPGDFFGQALDIGRSPEASLAEIEEELPPSRHGTHELPAAGEVRGGAADPCSPEEAAVWVQEVSRLSPPEQRRRLRDNRRFRQARFATAYLDYLDALRYERPGEAQGLAAYVLRELVPRLPEEAPGLGPPRRAVRCRALGVLGSCQRLRGEVPRAAGTIRRALAEARQYGLKETTADLLQRAAYVLSDRGRYQPALELLREAFEIYFDRNLGFALARSLVDRGIMMGYAGADGEAVEVLGRAYRELPEKAGGAFGGRDALGRNREAVYHHLVMAHTALGQMEAAERWLREAAGRLGDDRHVVARLSWQRGRLLLVRGESRRAEPELRKALEVFEEDRQAISELVRLDLLQALVGLGRGREALRLADEQASLARARRRTASADAFSRLARAGREGRLTLRLIRSAAGAFQKRRWPAR